MTDPAPPQRSSKRARLCSIENANRIATRVAEHVQGDTAVVKTGNPLQPFRVVLASKAAPGRTVSRVVTCNDDEPDDQYGPGPRSTNHDCPSSKSALADTTGPSGASLT